MMKLRLFVAVLFLAVAGVAAEPEMRLSPKKIRDEVRAVVEAQLSALREGDFAQAYEMASTDIKDEYDERFFAAMIRRGYPALLRPNDTDLGVVRDKNGEVAQVMVMLTDRLKRCTVYRFWLVREEEGWRINGITLEQRPPRGDA